MSNDKAFIKEYQKKIERKLNENEMATVQYWKERLDKLVTMKPDGIASLQLEIKKLSNMMENRIRSLKKEL